MISPRVVCLQVQKEKLHAELKQVLSQKRSHLRESTCQLAQPEMDSEPTEEQTVSSSRINALKVKYFLTMFPSVVKQQPEISNYHKSAMMKQTAHKNVTPIVHEVHNSLFPLWVVYELFPLVSHWKSGCSPRIEWPFLRDSLMDKMDSEVKCEVTNNCTANSALTQASDTRHKTVLKPEQRETDGQRMWCDACPWSCIIYILHPQNHCCIFLIHFQAIAIIIQTACGWRWRPYSITETDCKLFMLEILKAVCPCFSVWRKRLKSWKSWWRRRRRLEPAAIVWRVEDSEASSLKMCSKTHLLLNTSVYRKVPAVMIDILRALKWT